MTRLPRPAVQRDPADYPWPPVQDNRLLTADADWPMTIERQDEYDDAAWPQRTRWNVDCCADDHDTDIDAVLTALGAPGMNERTPVLAIGSNRSPIALREKFADDPGWAIPITVADVTGVYVGYAACVSGPGWVPWAPMRIDSAAAHAWPILWLTGPQIARLDATEPNYQRSILDAGHRVWIDSGQEIADVELYRSRHGLIGQPPAFRPVPAGDQERGLALVADALGRTPGHADLAADPDLRETARKALLGLAVHDGFEGRPWRQHEVFGPGEVTVEIRERAATALASRDVLIVADENAAPAVDARALLHQLVAATRIKGDHRNLDLAAELEANRQAFLHSLSKRPRDGRTPLQMLAPTADTDTLEGTDQ